MNEKDQIELAGHLSFVQFHLNDTKINQFLQDKQYLELINNMTHACISLQKIAVILSKYAIQKTFKDAQKDILEDINDITNSLSIKL